MSFLAGRLAAKEAAYFLEESKHAITRYIEKNPNPKTPIQNPNSLSSSSSSVEVADVLPEILRHSLPSNLFRPQEFSNSSISPSNASKWAIRSPSSSSSTQRSSVSPDVLNPLRGFLSLPQVTFGPKRWQLPTAESSVTASTANELRRDQYTHVNPEKLKAAGEGLQHIGKAFAAATAIIFGSAALTFGVAASKLDLHNSDDIRTKGRDLVQPKLEAIKEQLTPLRHWAESTSKKWHLENQQVIKERPIIKELSKILGSKTSP